MAQEARNKLRRMGGIMASSPELMQAAQGYQDGGPIMMQPPAVPRVSGYAPGLLPTGTVDPSLGYSARNAPISPTQARRNRALELGVESLRMDGPMSFGGGAQYRPTAPEMPFDRRVPAGPESGQPDRLDARVMRGVEAGEGNIGVDAGITVDDLMEGSGATQFTLPDVPTTRPKNLPSASDLVAQQNELRARRGLPPLSPKQEAEFGESAREAPLPAEAAEAEALTRELEEIEGRKFEDRFASSADAERAEEIASDLTGFQRRRGETLAAEDQAMSMPLTPKNLTQEQIDKAKELVEKDPNWTPPETTAGDEESDGTATSTDTGGGGGGGGGGKTTKKDLRSRYKEKIELFKEIYGEDDEERARDRAMSLAMMGLAIASGQSPDALTNIAQGAAAGLQGMSEQGQARRERDRGLQTLALESVLDEQAAGTAAEQDAAQSQLKFERDVFLKGLEQAGGGAGMRDARNIVDFTQNVYTSALDAASAGTAADFNPDKETPEQYASRVSESARTRFAPLYGGAGMGEGEPAAAPPVAPTVEQRIEQLRAAGRSNEEIAAGLRAKKLDPADYGL